MNVTEEKLIAYADGEVSGEDARAIEAVLKARPDLQAFVDAQRALRTHFSSGFAPLLNEEIPDRLLNAVAATRVSKRWRLERWAQAAAGRRFLLASAIPAAAALACGLVIGIAIAPKSGFGVDPDRGAMIARGDLSAALDRQLASTQGATEKIRVGITFKTRDRHYCRTFEAAALAGVACHEKQGWRVATLASAPITDSPYRMAGAMPAAVRDTVEKMIAGEPLNASQELRARDQGWQAQ